MSLFKYKRPRLRRIDLEIENLFYVSHVIIKVYLGGRSIIYDV